MRQDGQWSNDILDIKLLYRNAIVQPNLSLAEAGIVSSCKVTVIYELKPFDPISSKKLSLQSDHGARNPVLPPSRGYQTNPAFDKLASMTDG